MQVLTTSYMLSNEKHYRRGIIYSRGIVLPTPLTRGGKKVVLVRIVIAPNSPPIVKTYTCCGKSRLQGMSNQRSGKLAPLVEE